MIDYTDTQIVFSSDYGKTSRIPKNMGEDKSLQKRVAQMGLRITTNNDYAMARNMRRICNGAFGNMSKDEFNHRVIGTDGTLK